MPIRPSDLSSGGITKARRGGFERIFRKNSVRAEGPPPDCIAGCCGRVGQRALQASSDVMLGWTSIDGWPLYVLQMKNMKGSVPVKWLSVESFNFYAWACGAILARALA